MNRYLSTMLLLASLVLAVGVTAQTKKKANAMSQNPSTAVVADENRTEARSGIKDSVDIIRGPAVERVSRNSAVLVWTTNKIAATRVVYGPSQAQLTEHAYVPGGAKEHRVELRNLKPGTIYYYAIENRSGRQRYDGTFQTP